MASFKIVLVAVLFGVALSAPQGSPLTQPLETLGDADRTAFLDKVKAALPQDVLDKIQENANKPVQEVLDELKAANPELYDSISKAREDFTAQLQSSDISIKDQIVAIETNLQLTETQQREQTKALLDQNPEDAQKFKELLKTTLKGFFNNLPQEAKDKIASKIQQFRSGFSAAPAVLPVQV